MNNLRFFIDKKYKKVWYFYCESKRLLACDETHLYWNNDQLLIICFFINEFLFWKCKLHLTQIQLFFLRFYSFCVGLCGGMKITNVTWCMSHIVTTKIFFGICFFFLPKRCSTTTIIKRYSIFTNNIIQVLRCELIFSYNHKAIDKVILK